MSTDESSIQEVTNGCPKCLQHLFDQPGLAHAFPSVGVEYGKSSFEMAQAYFAHFHKNRHLDMP